MKDKAILFQFIVTSLLPFYVNVMLAVSERSRGLQRLRLIKLNVGILRLTFLLCLQVAPVHGSETGCATFLVVFAFFSGKF